MEIQKLYAREIIAYNDEELDRYLEENRRDRVSPNNQVQSRPVDLDQVSARLLQAITFDQMPVEGHGDSPAESSSSYDSEYELQRDIKWERESYDELVGDGAHPWYPIHMMEDIARNPQNYRELLRFARPNKWDLIGQQLVRWRRFREWQADMRTRYKGRISVLTQRVKAFFNKRSIAVPVEFSFDEDPKQQDKLTTWIEFLACEHDSYKNRYGQNKNLAKWYRKQWETLLESGVVKPHETETFILNESRPQREMEMGQANDTVESAKAALLSAQQAIDPARPSSAAQKRLAAAEANLDSAEQGMARTKHRNDLIRRFISDTFSYRRDVKSAEGHTILLEFIQGRIPVIQLELESKAVEGSSEGQKRKIEPKLGQDEAIESRSPKRQKPKTSDEQSHGDTVEDTRLSRRPSVEPPSHPEIVQDTATATQLPQESEVPEKRRRSGKKQGSEPSIAPLRRSARIAARQEPSKKPAVPASPGRGIRQRSRKARKAPAPTTGPQNRQAKARAAKSSGQPSAEANTAGELSKPARVSQRARRKAR
ncbi:hypothetical protein B0T24DRAFT_534466 [Lasiosphaeria ovina]|uniref:Uncharacterized protein n=1 Tax=Lasiosphaeria ovina TaxID=92902 RepID=A0AAE0JZ70_9PEZI|nr:hypothetical protein B0T24DRAFT_534466 [Lasiosphaeria ovina]